MKLEAFSVADSAVGAFMQPFFARSRGEAVRFFQDGCVDPKSQWAAHPEHFSLYHIGSWSDENGLFTPVDVPDRVCGALDFAKA